MAAFILKISFMGVNILTNTVGTAGNNGSLNNVFTGYNPLTVVPGTNVTQPATIGGSNTTQPGISTPFTPTAPVTTATNNGDGTTTTTTAPNTGGSGAGQQYTAPVPGSGSGDAPVAKNPIYKEWWFYAGIAGVLVGGYFLIKKIGK